MCGMEYSNTVPCFYKKEFLSIEMLFTKVFSTPTPLLHILLSILYVTDTYLHIQVRKYVLNRGK